MVELKNRTWVLSYKVLLNLGLESFVIRDIHLNFTNSLNLKEEKTVYFTHLSFFSPKKILTLFEDLSGACAKVLCIIS